MKKLLGVVLVSVFMLGAGLALAREMQRQCQRPCAPDGKMEQKQGDWQAKRLDRMAKELNLTAEQKNKVSAIMDKTQEEMKAVRDAREKKVKAVLTPDQAKKFDEMKAEMQKKMGEGRGMGRMRMRERHKNGECQSLKEEMPMMEKK